MQPPQWTQLLQSLATAYVGLASSVSQLCEAAETDLAQFTSAGSSAVTARNALSALSRSVTAAANALSVGLEGFAPFAEATMSRTVITQGPQDASWGLYLNATSVLLAQLSAQERELCEALSKASSTMTSLKANALRSIAPLQKPDSPASTAVPLSQRDASPQQSRQRTQAASEDEEEEEGEDQASPAGGIRSFNDPVNVTVAPPPALQAKKKKGSSKKSDLTIVPHSTDDVDAAGEGEIGKAKKKLKGSKSKKAAGAAKDASAQPPSQTIVIAKRDLLAPPPPDVSPRSDSTDSFILHGRNPREPDFLKVVTVFKDSLPPLVRSSLPDVFTAPEDVMRGSIVQQYYIRLQPVGSLALLCLRCWLHLDADIESDFACDILGVDRVEAEPFSYVGSTINVSDENDLSNLPACGWRRMVSDDHTKILHTMFAFVDKPVTMPRSLLIHDAIADVGKEEVVTLITPLGATDAYAKVAVYSTRSRGSDPPRAAAVASMTKDVLEHCGFEEVDEDVVKDAVTPSSAAQRSLERTDPSQDSVQPEYFVDPASLRQQGAKKKKGMLNAMVGLGKKVALAPVQATMAVAKVAADAAESVMVSQADGKFAEWFPSLAAETVVDVFNCALSEGALKQGVLYVTNRWLAFHATVLTRSVTLPFDEVRDIRKEKTMKLFDNAIEVETFSGEKYFFTSFLNRDAAFATIFNTWRVSGN